MLCFNQWTQRWRCLFLWAPVAIALLALPARSECNSPPQATPDDITTLDVQAALLDPLANDFDPEGQPLSLQVLGDSCLGTVATSDDTLTFSPVTGVAEICSISYRAVDSQGASATASISIAVQLFEPFIFEDGFESGTTLGWSATVIE